jgi:hypothetical protein
VNPPGIPAKGTAYLRKAATGNMTSTVRINRPSAPVYDPVTHTAVATTGSVGYTGQAHVHPVSGGADVYAGDALTALMTVQVSIPWDATPVPREEDQVFIVACEDPSLVNKTLRIVDVLAGGIGFPVRALSCTFVEANPFVPGA